MVLKADVLLSKEPEIQDDTRICPGPDVSIRKGITMNLDVVVVILVISDHELGFGIIKWDRERVGGVFLLVPFDRIFIVRVGGDIIDDAVFEDDLWGQDPSNSS